MEREDIEKRWPTWVVKADQIVGGKASFSAYKDISSNPGYSN